MKYLPAILIVVSQFLAFNMGGQEQDTIEPVRPKIGLVLSGGGAKGLAHVGVLKVLEDAGIVPDYITGTSMGSIIGGLYASGYSAAQLDSIVRSANWNSLLSDQIPLKNVVPEEKKDYYRFLTEFNITTGGVRLKAGMIQGQQISEFLSQLTWPVAHIKDFDHLPIPFRCVAADLISGKPYIFKDGNLATAMRASMSIPSVFAPVITDGMYLVDGGVLDNFPVKLCKEMGADIIIGVNVGFTDTYTLENLNSMHKVLIASSSIGSNLLQEEANRLTDILIQPDLKPFTTASFFDAGKIIDLGMRQALPYLEQLTALADSIYQREPLPHVKHYAAPYKIKIKEIRTTGLKNISHEFVVSQLGFSTNDSVTVTQVNQGLRKLLGTRFLDQVRYELAYEDNGYIMLLNTVETNPTTAAFSIDYNNVYGVGLIGNITLRNLFIKNSRLSITAEASKSPQINTNFFTYTGEKMDFGMGIDLEYNRSILPIYRRGNGRYGTFAYRYTHAGFNLNYSPNTSILFAPGVIIERHALLSDTGFPEFFDNGVRKFGFNQSKLVFPIFHNTLDRRYFPSKGLKMEIIGTANFWTHEVYKGSAPSKSLVDQFLYGADKRYIAIFAQSKQHFDLNKKLNLAISASANYFINHPPLSSLYFIGGDNMVTRLRDLPFVGLHYREQLVENYLYAQTNLRFNPLKSIYINFTWNGIYNARLHNQFIPDPISYLEKEWLFGYGISLAANSIIGPVSFGFGLNNYDSKARFYFNVGLPF
ncbi:MAG: patatin-like phospholipase family protein [Breznakibacter sp.]